MTIDPLRFALVALAVYRLAVMLTREDGPADVFVRLRTWAGCYDYSERPGPNGLEPRTSLGKLMSCPYCVGVWLSMAGAVVVASPGAWDWLVLVLALAGAQRLMGRFVDK